MRFSTQNRDFSRALALVIVEGQLRYTRLRRRERRADNLKTVDRTCTLPGCHESISSRARYCSDAHRLRAFRARVKARNEERDALLAALSDALSRAEVRA